MPKFKVQLSQKRWEFCEVIVEAEDEIDASLIAEEHTDDSELRWEPGQEIERTATNVQIIKEP